MTDDIVKARKIIEGLFSAADELSQTEEERKEIYSFSDFLECDSKDLFTAFHTIEDTPLHSNDLFNFSLATKIQHHNFQQTNIVWEKLGIPHEPVLINVKFDITRNSGELSVATLTISDMERILEENSSDAWANYYLSTLRSFDTPVVYVLYTDDELSNKHGFPFDIGIVLPMPEFLDDSKIIQLLMKCLNQGYNVLDSYQLFKFEQNELDKAFANMILSNRFNEKQVLYVNSFLRIRPVLEKMLEDDEFIQVFSKTDSKRYTEVLFDDAAPFDNRIRSFSEHGLVDGTNEKIPVSKFLEQLAERTNEQDEGDHIVRFFNTSYMSKFNEPMWVPILLRGKEVSYPRPHSLN